MINLTTGGAPYMTIEERVRPAATFKPEVASLNLGSMNFGLFGMLDRFKDLKHEWERTYLANKDIIFRNTFGQIEYILDDLRRTTTRASSSSATTPRISTISSISSTAAS